MGYEAVSAIRANPRLSGTPIVAVSASVLELDQEQSRLAGCDDFLVKPIDADRLLAVVGRLLGLEWIAGAPTADETPEAADEPVAAVPPRADLEELYELARFGNMQRLQERAAALEHASPQYRPFARQVARLAEAFDDERVQELIRQHVA
jgi:CheY-like chemotaxis protein